MRDEKGEWVLGRVISRGESYSVGAREDTVDIEYGGTPITFINNAGEPELFLEGTQTKTLFMTDNDYNKGTGYDTSAPFSPTISKISSRNSSI